MEENNNDEKTILDKGKEVAKKEAKNLVGKGFKKILPHILPYIAGLFAILLFAGLILAIPVLIQEVFKSLLGGTDKVGESATSWYSNDFLEAAQQVHDEEMDWVYATDGSLAGTVQGALTNKNKTTCCATYVSCVLYASGYFTAEEINQYNYDAAGQVDKLLDDHNWERIEGKENLQPGDIIVYKKRNKEGNIVIGHVDIYAGNDMFYNAGNTEAIQNPAPYSKPLGANWDKDSEIVEWWAYRLPSSGSTNPPAERKLYDGQIISIDKNGAYKLNVKNLGDQLLEELESQKVDNELIGFAEELSGETAGEESDSSLETLKDMIDKYIEAEVQTTYPETKCAGNDLDGIIKIKRASGRTGTVVTDQDLDYVSADKFDEMIKNGNTDIYNCFSLDPATFELWIARPGSSTTYYDFNNKAIKTENSEKSIVKEKFDYQEHIENYSTPLNFFVTLHLISQNKDFMQDFLDTILGEGSTEPLVLTYIEDYSTNTVQYDYYGSETSSVVEAKDPSDYLSSSQSYQTQIDKLLPEDTTNDETEQITPISNSNIQDYISNIEYHKKVITESSGRLCLTSVDTWLQTSSKEINIIPSNSNPDISVTVIKDEDKLPILFDEFGENIGHIKITEKVTITEDMKKFVVVDEDSKIRVDNFIDLIREYPKVENNFTSAPSNIFYLLQQDEKTQRHERIMRYVMYELNDVDYGVTAIELEYLLSNEEKYTSSSQLLTDFIRIWEHASEPPTNEDGTCYIIETDGYGHPTVGYGVDIGANENEFIENSYPTEVGGEVPIEFVDSLEKRIVSKKIEDIKSMTSGLDLTSYQINALVSRAYNCGTAGALEYERGEDRLNFVESYNKYWDEEKERKFEEEDNIADFNHQLYTQYMSMPNTSEGKYSKGLENRRKSEWTLFQTGYYDRLGKWHTSGDDIVVVADEIHKYMEQHEYTYCVHEPDGSRGDECKEKGIPCKRLKRTFEASKTTEATCCATYVSWVLQEAGFLDVSEHTNGASSMVSTLRKKGWIEIENYEDLAPGDVLYYYRTGSDGFSGIGHVDIYAGDGTKYNAGGGYIIRASSPSKMSASDFYGALRAP